LAVPNDLGKAEVGNLDCTDATRANSWDKLAFVFLVFIAGLTWRRMFAWNEFNGVEE
jgi:hypothetical protein